MAFRSWLRLSFAFSRLETSVLRWSKHNKLDFIIDLQHPAHGRVCVCVILQHCRPIRCVQCVRVLHTPPPKKDVSQAGEHKRGKYFIAASVSLKVSLPPQDIIRRRRAAVWWGDKIYETFSQRFLLWRPASKTSCAKALEFSIAFREKLPLFCWEGNSKPYLIRRECTNVCSVLLHTHTNTQFSR